MADIWDLDLARIAEVTSAVPKRAYNRTITGRDSHGQSRTPLYRIWGLIKQRCTNPNHTDFASYGGRGIKMCDEWFFSFRRFADDMGGRPSPAHQIDRIDNDGPYSAENCRWALRSTQARNRRDTRLFEYAGEWATLAGWSERTGIARSTLAQRIYVNGWDPATAISTPTMKRGRRSE